MIEKDKINVAIAGVGALASAFVQGIEYLKAFPDKNKNLLHPNIGGYEVANINIVAAFDVDINKVGKDLSEAIFVPINSTPKFVTVPKAGVNVEKGYLKDGIKGMLETVIKVDDKPEVDVTKILKETKAEMLICALPTGAVEAVEAYAEAALEAEVAFVNCTPTYIASNPEWSRKFRKANVALVGDDIQSLHGGTVIHKALLQVFKEQGVHIINTYQLDVAGGLETFNTLDDDRKAFKRQVKERSIQKSLDNDVDVASGTSDYLEFLGNRRIGHFWVFGEGFLGMPIKMDIRYETLDGPNGAATLIDIVRATKVALSRADSGPLPSISAYGFKVPPVLVNRDYAHVWFVDYLLGKRSK